MADASDTLLRVEHLTMRFGGLTAVDDLSFDAREGDITALIGPNGAGKTTALRAVARLLAYEGRVRMFGSDVAELSRREVARLVALVPQVPLIPGDITVSEYVLLGRTPHLSYFGGERRADHEAVQPHAARTLGTE